MDETNAAGLSSGIFALLVSVVPTKKVQNPLLFLKFHQKLANSDVTKKTLNCAVSLWQLTALLTPLVSSGILLL